MTFDKEKLKSYLSRENAKNLFTKDNMKSALKPTKKKVVVLAGVFIFLFVIGIFAKNNAIPTGNIQTDDTVSRGDIKVTITGSAAVEPYERYEIIPKVSGDITYCPYEVGDEVKKDDVLYMFDSSDSDLTVERQRISMQQSENTYTDALKERDKLYIKAKNDGIISEFSIKNGQEVKTGTKIASITDMKKLEVELPFTAAQIGNIYVGDSAIITSSKHMSSVYGTVSHKSSSSYAGADGTMLYTVTISFENPGAFYGGMTVGGCVGDNISPGSGVIENMASSQISAETDGTVTDIYYKNGDYVKKGRVIATLSSDTVNDKIANSTLSYKSAQISMRQTEKDLENYSIKSPINGTVITKKAKAGDTIEKTTQGTTMMVVADISKLKFELAIDELDVSRVHKGQEVLITCDAVPGEKFLGIITNVSVEGVAQNGVTTYQAEVEIAEPGNLRPSMNIDAEVVIESADNVLMVPTEDIKTIGSRSYVFVKKSDYDEKINSIQADNTRPVLNPDMDDSAFGAPFEKDEKNNNAQGDKKNSFVPEAPEGYVTVEVRIGISSEDYTQIKAGLLEGQQIYKQSKSSSSSNMMQGGMMDRAMGGMPPGMMGGMSGGMSGGARGISR